VQCVRHDVMCYVCVFDVRCQRDSRTTSCSVAVSS
jgi:hypothetical protein